MRQVAECLATLGVESRQQLKDLISSMADNACVQEAWQQQLVVEEKMTKAIAAVEAELRAGDGSIGEVTGVGELLPDLPLLELETQNTVGLRSILKSSPFTLLVLVRHFG